LNLSINVFSVCYCGVSIRQSAFRVVSQNLKNFAVASVEVKNADA